ncbi:MAG: peptidylprolyl isomerase [Pseudomonadales bacterium]|nr:peptidylprolyl isomerase [Pseudomonadales bacterium]
MAEEKYVPVGPGTQVELLFSLKLESGDLIDSTGDTVASLVVGDGSLLPGFEQAMFGLKAGDKESLLVMAEAGFGIPDPENIQRMERAQFQDNMDLAVGLMMSFADAQNAELPGIIINLTEDYVDIDFNHPLAGKNLTFEVEIIAVAQLTNEILRVGS